MSNEERHTGCTLEEFVKQDLHGIEPVQDFWLATRCDTLPVIAFTEIP